MESILDEGTPLAAYLEGEGTNNDIFGLSEQTAAPDSPTRSSFVTAAPSSLRSRLRNRAPTQLHIRLPRRNRLSEAHIAWSKAINSRLGRTENEHFTEHFRYILIASQLLNAHLDHGSKSAAGLTTADLESRKEALSQGGPLAFEGLCLTAGLAFGSVWLIHWLWNHGRGQKSKVFGVVTGYGMIALVSYFYLRRQWLKYVREQAVESASNLTTNLQAFDIASASALSLIQEVELVSKGYRISTALPPVSRLDDTKITRRCAGLRRQLSKLNMAIIQTLHQEMIKLRGLMKVEDYDKFLDAYDIPRDLDMDDPLVNGAIVDVERESLGALRISSDRYGTLRRSYLCALLSLEADGGAPDFLRWRSATSSMNSVSRQAALHAQSLSEALKELEEFACPTTPKFAPKMGGERLKSQVRKISTLSQGIRSLQAKMMLLREESNKAIETSDDLTDLGPTLMAQYESIGADIKTLMQDWETGKFALATNIGKHERRISRASSGIRSPVSSLGGLTAVEEDGEGGGPEDALRALMGEKETRSNRSSLATTPSDEEVFEAIALPRQRERSILTREERIVKMHEERAKQAELREKRSSNTNMIRELQSVINLRKPTRNSMGRITSI